MMHLTSLSLRQKLIGLGTVSATVALMLAAIGFLAYDRTASQDAILRNTTAIAEVVGHTAAAALAFNDPASGVQILAGLRAKPAITAAALYGVDGSVFAAYTRAGSADFTPPVPDGESAIFASQRLTLWRRVILDGEHIGYIYFESDLTELRVRQKGFVTILLGIMVASIAVSVLLSSWLQRKISQPILDLGRVARQVSASKDYSLRASTRARDEAGDLVGIFNEMLATVESRDLEVRRSRQELEEEIAVRAAVNTQLEAARQKAEAASRAKGEFLANMSHELRTPMNGIIGMTDLALDTDLSIEQRECLDTVRASADTLLSILNDVLDFSKIESGKLELESLPFSPRATIAAALRPFALRASQKQLELICEIAPEVPDGVVGDPTRLKQVLSNVVANALKFTEQGHVLVSVREERRAAGCTRLRFSITDTGIGISADRHADIFEAFRQADGSTTRRFGGTGLGLTISSTLVRLMGGRLWVDSAPGIGSTFHFTVALDVAAVLDRAALPTLPAELTRVVARRSAPPPASALAMAPGGRRVRVLLVEDNVVNQRVAAGLLMRRGHEVVVAQHGAEALALLSIDRFDLVLMDLQMPVMGGIEATHAIRASERELGGHVRIVAMTAHAMIGDRERCLAAGMDGYLSKPIHPPMLYAVVEKEAEAVGAAEPAVPSPEPAIFDENALLQRVSGDSELMTAVIQVFLEDCPARLAAINEAVVSGDPVALRAAAHALKGAAANLSANALFEAADVLERLGADARMGAAEGAWRQLSVEATHVMELLRARVGSAEEPTSVLQ